MHNVSSLGDDYYKANIATVRHRIEQGDIRLAGVLNEVFKEGLKPSAPGAVKVVTPQVDPAFQVKTPIKVDAKDVSKYIGQNIYTVDKVVPDRLIESNQMTLLNINGKNPNQDFNVMIKSENRSKFGRPEIDLKGKSVAVTGYVIGYKEKPEVEVSISEQLQLVN